MLLSPFVNVIRMTGKNIHKGFWTSSMSPYDERYVDVMFSGEIFDSVAITVEEDTQRWRLFLPGTGLGDAIAGTDCQQLGWVPFYYTSSMFIGVLLLVVIILLSQGIKLLPTGRKSAFYLTIYGSLLGAGSFLLHHFSVMINSILVNFGLSEDSVSILVLVVLVVVAGAGLGYWIVRRNIVSEDGGEVDAGITQLVKWAMRILGSTLILQTRALLIHCWLLEHWFLVGASA